MTDLKLLGLGKWEAEEAAKILVELMDKGEAIEMRDALIEGCMLKTGCSSIVTKNVEHFSRIPKLEVLSY